MANIASVIPQQNSWGRICISQGEAEQILWHYQVFTPFVHLLCGLGFKVKEDEYYNPCYTDQTSLRTTELEGLDHYGL
jgi:hypothetical protein